MRDADTTWALVVGIDAYDHVKPLTGPVRDAIAVVGWLRQLGVADDRILLHASPCPDSVDLINDVGIAYQGCTEPEIWQSLEILLQNDGSRLFVFLLGHGYFLFDGGPVFLTKEANGIAAVNIGVTWLAGLLRAKSYERQFILLDGCLNYAYAASQRPTITPGEHPGVAAGAALANVSQWFGYAASQGETAAEPSGRGLFTTTLLTALDLAAPNPLCTALDDTTGDFLLDLSAAITDVVSPAVSQQIATQHPGIQRLDTGPATKHPTVATITPAQPIPLQTLVDPAAAVADVDSVTLVTPRFPWKRTVPDPTGSALALPLISILPAGVKVIGSCAIKPHAEWSDPDIVAVETGSGDDVVFRLRKDRSSQTLKVTTVGPDDAPVPAMNADAVNAATRAIAGSGAQNDLWLAPSRTGGIVYATLGGEQRLNAVSESLARAIDVNTPNDVHTLIEPQDLPPDEPQWHGWMLEVELDLDRALALGGFIASDEDVVHVGQSSMSLTDLARVGRVAVDDFGPARVEVNLPWGRWAALIEPPERAAATSPPKLVLPRSMGLPPVRNSLLASIVRQGSDKSRSERTAFRLAVATAEPVELYIAAGESITRLLRGDDSFEGWIAQRPDARTSGSGGGTTLFDVNQLPSAGWPIGRLDVRSLPDPLYFPMYWPDLGFDNRLTPRIEPLSDTTLLLWDLLVGAGRLDALDEERAEEVTGAAHPIVRLVGMYGCYANGLDEPMRQLLQRLPSPMPDDELGGALPDVVILRHAFAMRTGGSPPPDLGQLHKLAFDDRVPVFKWGLSIGQTVARHYDVPTLADKLGRIEDRLLTASNWTLWHGGRP
jgi:hypothetical protein